MKDSRMLTLAFFCTCLVFSHLSSEDSLPESFTCYFNEPDFYPELPPCQTYPHKFFLGPEIYYVKRRREGGTRQGGGIYGVRAGYERIQRNSFYWGGEVLYGAGTLDGKSANSNKIKSRFTDEEIEGRFGYTLQSRKKHLASFTPFAGYGYFRETNQFCHPTAVKLKFANRYSYIAAGFLFSLYLNPQLTFGVNFKARAMLQAKCKVSNDPEFQDSTLAIQDRFNYRIELPFCYYLCKNLDHFEVDVVPFFELRHYGGRENFPFDFHDTKLRIYGISLFLAYRL